MASNPAALITPEQYLEAERRAETKSEYYAGQVFALAGASMRHNLIVANLVVEIGRQIKGRDCIVLPNDMRLRVTATGLYTYPDVTVVCGTPQLEDEHLDTLLNPTLLIEVISESTEAYDRGRKAEHYRRIDSLEEHLLVAQDEPWIVHYRRQAQREWVLTDVRGLSADLELRSVDCVLSLRDVYEKAF